MKTNFLNLNQMESLVGGQDWGDNASAVIWWYVATHNTSPSPSLGTAAQDMGYAGAGGTFGSSFATGGVEGMASSTSE